MRHKQDKTLILVVVLAVILVAGGLGAIVLNNHFVTERQTKLQNEKTNQLKAEQDAKDASDASERFRVSLCKADAETQYWNYVKLNATSTKKDADGQDIYYMPQSNWDFAEKQKQNSISNC